MSSANHPFPVDGVTPCLVIKPAFEITNQDVAPFIHAMTIGIPAKRMNIVCGRDLNAMKIRRKPTNMDRGTRNCSLFLALTWFSNWTLSIFLLPNRSLTLVVMRTESSSTMPKMEMNYCRLG